MSFPTLKHKDHPTDKEGARAMGAKALGRSAAASRAGESGMSMDGIRPVLAERLEGLISTVIRKLMPPKGIGGDKAIHSREVYRADAISLLLAASQHMGPAASEEDRLILELLLEAQKAAVN